MSEQDQRLLALAAAGRRLAGCTSMAELAPVAADLALELLEANTASLSVVERDHGLLRVLTNRGDLADWEEEEPADETYAIEDFPLLATTIEQARPWFGDRGDPATGRAHHDLLEAMGMYSSISLPVVVGQAVWGEIGAARTADRRRFTPADVAVGEAYVGLLGAAVARIEEREELHALAFNDALTGLANRRAIDDRLELLFAEDPLPQPVSLVLCDVDGLKRLNDTLGHDAGDRLLREVAAALTRVAGSDTVSLAARLGGDEFCLLLEGAGPDEVEAVTQRLIAEAAALPMGAGLSCGWTSARRRPGGALTAKAAARGLLRLADAAQYRAKRGGRDTVRLTAPDVQRGREIANEVAAAALRAVRAVGPCVEERLEAVALTFVDRLHASGWSVSVRIEDGPIEIVRSVVTRRADDDRPALGPGVAFDPGDYPETVAALDGGVFHATIDHGHQAERAFLAAYGHDEIVGAGARQDERTAWLVEVVGDASTRPLVDHLPILHALTAYAVDGARSLSEVSGPNAAP